MKYDIKVNSDLRVLIGCPDAVQQTYSLARSGPVRGIKQRNKRYMLMFNDNVRAMQKDIKQRKTQIHRH